MKNYNTTSLRENNNKGVKPKGAVAQIGESHVFHTPKGHRKISAIETIDNFLNGRESQAAELFWATTRLGLTP